MRGARPCAVRGAAGSRQDDARADRGARARRQFPRHLRPGDRQGGRSRGAAHQSRRRATCCSSTRSTGSIRRSRKSSIRRWRTSSSTSSSARGRRRARCASISRRFTLIGATTRTGLLTTPLRERFGIPIRLEFYSVAELEEIVRRGARLLGLPLTRRGRARDRAARARHAARRGPAAAPRARLRERSKAPARSMRRSPTAR